MRKKGIIFALDGAIAVTIILIMLINTTYYFTTTSKESLSQTQVIKRGYDVLAMFDELEELDDGFRRLSVSDDTISETFIRDTNLLNVSHFLPSGYDMMLILDDAKKTLCSGDCLLDGDHASIIIDTGELGGGNFIIQVNANFTSSPSSGADPSFTVNGYPIIQSNEKCFANVACTYSTKNLVMNLAPGINTLTIMWDNSNPVNINWIKVLDDPAYSLSTEKVIPTNRFIGTGERWFAAFDENGHFDGFHRARFKVWIV